MINWKKPEIKNYQGPVKPQLNLNFSFKHTAPFSNYTFALPARLSKRERYGWERIYARIFKRKKILSFAPILTT